MHFFGFFSSLLGDDSGYTKTVISVKAKNKHVAYSKALNILDYLRSIFCFFINDRDEIIGDPYKPINKIMLGPLHTLHDSDGKLSTIEYWFELNYKKINIYRSKHSDIFNKNVDFFIKKAKSLSYEDKIIESMIRYVRSLDSQDQNDALLKEWGALESIVTPDSGDDYSKIVNRCAFLHSEPEYHRQLLEHLRRRRNEYVHVGEKTQDSKTCCYQVQEYFRNIILFHLKSKPSFDSLLEANTFLDLPTDAVTLTKKFDLYKKAIKWRGF